MSTTQRRSDSRPGAASFLVIQVVLILALASWGGLRARQLESGRSLPALRSQPLEIAPLYDDPEVISDEQLRRVLSRLGFRAHGQETSLGHVDHALRFWGSKVTFEDPEILSGSELRALLADHSRFAELYGPDQPPLLIDDGRNVRVRALEGPATSSHVDHTLASLAEVGTPLDYQIVTPRRQTTLRSVLERSLEDFRLDQVEYEWSALTYALFLQPLGSWVTRDGQEVTFDRLAGRIMRERLPNGVCSGNHRLYSLVVFLRVDDQRREAGEAPLLSPEERRRVLDYLAEATDMLVRHQHPDGFWNGDWPNAAPAASEPSGRAGDTMSTRLIVTGHALEWWAMAPREVHPPHSVLVDAGQWLVRTIDGLSEEEIASYYSFLSHVGRALALWRGRLPDQVELDV